jgi:hypothetical protein
MRFLQEAQAAEPDVHIDIEKPFWWDFPVWVASQAVDSVGLANNHMCRSRMLENEAWGRPRDSERLPAPTGNGYWSQEIYYHLLNCGLRLPPSAGSASGVLPNPVGYNRVYVHLEGPLDWNAWWDGLRKGRSFVTNGPLLTCRVNGRLPGHVFALNETPLELKFDLSVVSKDPIDRVELIHNGRVVQTVLPAEWASMVLSVQEPGWFLVRAITDNRRTFRFASTAPFHIESSAGDRRVSRAAAQFFLDWLSERRQRITSSLPDALQRRDVLRHHDAARTFWMEQRNAANCD